jgi:hypothetical protein
MLSRFQINLTAAAMSSYTQSLSKKLFSTLSVSSSVTATTGRLLNLNDMASIPGSMRKVSDAVQYSFSALELSNTKHFIIIEILEKEMGQRHRQQ